MKLKITTLLFALLYLIVIIKDTHYKYNSNFDTISSIIAILSIIAVATYFLYKIKINISDIWSSNKLIFAYFFSLILINTLFFPINPTNLFRLFAYSVIGISSYLIIPYYLFNDPALKITFFKIVIYYSLLVAISTFWPLFIGNNFFGLPITIKEGYTFFGIQANSGILSHPLTTGTQLLLGIGCSYLLFTKKKHVIYCVFILVMILSLLITQARGAFLGLFIGISVLLLPNKMISSKLLMPIIFCISFPLIFLILVPLLKNVEIFNDLLRLEGNIYSYREILWLYGFQIIAENPWSGYGFLTSSTILGESGILDSIHSLDAGAPFHSTFIDNAVDSGIIITGIYLMLFLIPINRLGKYSFNNKESGIMLAICWAILFSAIFINYNIGGVRSVSFTIAILLGLSNYSILNKYRLGV